MRYFFSSLVIENFTGVISPHDISIVSFHTRPLTRLHHYEQELLHVLEGREPARDGVARPPRRDPQHQAAALAREHVLHRPGHDVPVNEDVLSSPGVEVLVGEDQGDADGIPYRLGDLHLREVRAREDKGPVVEDVGGDDERGHPELVAEPPALEEPVDVLFKGPAGIDAPEPDY